MMKKACIAMIPMLIALCLFCAPHAALASEDIALCSASVSQSEALVAPGDTVTVSIHVSVTAGSTGQLAVQLGEVNGLTITNASVSGGWHFAVNSPSYLNVRGGPASAGSSITITLTMAFAPDADGTYNYDVYNVSYFDPVYDEPMSAGGGTASFEVHTRGADWVIDRQPTCVLEGRSVIKCVNCGYIYEINPNPIPMVAHVPGTPVVTTPSACLTEGVETTYCANCNTVLAAQTVPGTGHTPGGWQTALAPTCTAVGLAEKHCGVCNVLLDSATIAATGHTPGGWQTALAPTCTAVGLAEKHCGVCNVLLDSATIAATGHTPGEWQTALAPTCTAVGSAEKYCTVCNVLLDTESIAATGHTPGRWQTIIAPTCTETGKWEKYCDVCDVRLNVVTVPAKDHTPGDWIVTLRQTTENPGIESLLCTVCSIALETRELPITSEPKQDSPAALPGESLQETAPKLAEKWPAYTTIDLRKPQVFEFPIVAQGGYVVGTATVTVDENGVVTITYTLTAKGAAIKMGALAFLPPEQDLTELAPEDLAETTLDPAAGFTYTVPLSQIPQKDGVAMLCLNLMVDFDVYAEGVTEYVPVEQE